MDGCIVEQSKPLVRLQLTSLASEVRFPFTEIVLKSKTGQDVGMKHKKSIKIQNDRETYYITKTHLMNEKMPYFSRSYPKTSLYLHSDFIQMSPKSHQRFWLLL